MSEYVCVCLRTRVSNITVACLFKNVLRKNNILRIIRLVNIKESKRDFLNVFCKAEKLHVGINLL